MRTKRTLRLPCDNHGRFESHMVPIDPGAHPDSYVPARKMKKCEGWKEVEVESWSPDGSEPPYVEHYEFSIHPDGKVYDAI